MVSPHNISEQMENAYRQFQEETGIEVLRNHIQLRSGQHIPIATARFAFLPRTNTMNLHLEHPHESGALVSTNILGADDGRGFSVSHHSTLNLLSPNTNITRASSLEDMKNGFNEHLAEVEKAARQQGVHPELTERVRNLGQRRIGRHMGVHRDMGVDRPVTTFGTFDDYGRFTVDNGE